jgi:hypothetical protein
MSWSTYLKRVLPGFMGGGVMPLLLDGVASPLADLQERHVLGRMAALPFAGASPARRSTGELLQCDTEVLAWHARDRGLRLYATEPISSQRRRLAQWRQLHAERGTHRGALRHLQPYFLGVDGLGVLPRIRIVHQDGGATGATWHTLSGSLDAGGPGIYAIHRQEPTNWKFDPYVYKWSRWWAILYLTGTIYDDAPIWDSTYIWDGGSVWDGVRADVIADWVAMIADWSSAHSQLAGVILASSLTDLDPAGTATVDPEGWTTYPVSNWGILVDPDTGQPTRPPYLRWIYDLYYKPPT